MEYNNFRLPKTWISLKGIETDLTNATNIHQRLFKNGFLSYVVVVSALLDIYAKCGSIKKAREFFNKIHDLNKKYSHGI